MRREHIELHCASEFKSIAKKHRSFESDYSQSFTLLNMHLCEAKPQKPLGSKRLIHLHSGDGFDVWKFHVMTKGLKPNQWPRMWVGVFHAADTLVPLRLGMHSDNYDDSEMQRGAISEMSGYVEARTHPAS